MPQKVRLLAIASGGGHWVQLLRLRPAWDGCDVHYATVDENAREMIGDAPFYTFTNASRKNKLTLVRIFFEMSIIIAKVRPAVIITTGAAPPLLALAIGRLIGARTLWLDSIANSEIMSTSGTFAARFSTCLTQWPDLTRTHKIHYWGSTL